MKFNLENPTLNKMAQKPFFVLIPLYLVITAAVFFLKDFAYYADEFKDYFTTARGIVYGHTLGEWYERTDMRSYTIILPIVLSVEVLHLIGISNLYVQFELLKLVIALFSFVGAFFVHGYIQEKFKNKQVSFFAALLFVLHPVCIFYSQSLLTEQLALLTFIFNLYVYEKLKNPGTTPSMQFVLLFTGIMSSGLAISARLDAVFFLLPIYLFYFWDLIRSGKPGELIIFFAGAISAFVIIGVTELVYSGTFYGPQINRILFEGLERKGVIGATSPFGYALESLAGNMIHVFFFIFLYCYFKDIFCFIRRKKKLNILILPLGLYAAFHLWLPHKEFRYLYPIAFIAILYVIHFFTENRAILKKKILITLTALTLINALVVTAALPWKGQPRLPQQIAKLEYLFPEKDIYILEPPLLNEHDSFRPLKESLTYTVFQEQADLPAGNFILSMYDDKAGELEVFLKEKCDEIGMLTDEARKNLTRSNYRHFECDN